MNEIYFNTALEVSNFILTVKTKIIRRELIKIIKLNELFRSRRLIKKTNDVTERNEEKTYRSRKVILFIFMICSGIFIGLIYFSYFIKSYRVLKLPNNSQNVIKVNKPINDSHKATTSNNTKALNNVTKSKQDPEMQKIAAASKAKYEEEKIKLCKQLGITSEEFDRRIESGQGVEYIPPQESNPEDVYVSNFLKEHPTKRVNLTELQIENPFVIGWLRFPHLNIDEPVVLSKKDDYNYYLTHDIEGRENSSGSIELDYHSMNKTVGSDSNCILYGHNMLDGSKFGRLKNILNKSTQDKVGSDLIEYMTSDNTGILFKIVSVFITDENDNFYKSVNLNLNDNITYKTFSDSIKNRNIISKFNDLGTIGNGFISLSTCYGVGDNGKRLVVVAKEVCTISAN